MVGKLFLFALVCVSFAQGLGLEDAIKRGLAKAEGMDRYGKALIEAALWEVNYKSEDIRFRVEDYVQNVKKRREDVRQGLRSIALATEKRAKESNKPNSVFECIKRVEETANGQVESLTKKFEADMHRLEETKRANIKTDTKPLGGMEQSLEVRYEEVVMMISSCQDEDCVNTNVNSFVTWLDTLLGDVRRILGQVSTIFGSFQGEANTLNKNTSREFPRIEGTGAGDIRTCLEEKEAIFGENRTE